MQSEDLQIFAHLGQSLWPDPAHAQRMMGDTLTAILLMNLSEDRELEKATAALYQCAERDGSRVNGYAISRPFFRLSSQERMILSALHEAKWSYARLGRIFKISADDIAAIAWNARLRLASMPENQTPVLHPTGSKTHGVSCPEYDSSQPWTQRLLDEEMAAPERIFIQNHLVVCSLCQQALTRCRKLYYAVDAMIPRGHDEVQLEQVYRQARNYTRPIERTFWESIKIFADRPDIKWILRAIVSVFVYAILKLFLK